MWLSGLLYILESQITSWWGENKKRKEVGVCVHFLCRRFETKVIFSYRSREIFRNKLKVCSNGRKKTLTIKKKRASAAVQLIQGEVKSSKLQRLGLAWARNFPQSAYVAYVMSNPPWNRSKLLPLLIIPTIHFNSTLIATRENLFPKHLLHKTFIWMSHCTYHRPRR